MEEENKKIEQVKATKEMVAYWAGLQAKSNSLYAEQSVKNKLTKNRKELVEKIAEATIGYGLALKSLNEIKEQIERDINIIESKPSFNMQNEFMQRYGIDPFKLNLSGFVEKNDKLEPIED